MGMGMAEAVCWGVRDGASDQGSDWLSAHTALKRIARERAAADAEEGRCLLSALRAGVHRHLGCGSFAEYVERLLGYSSRATREKLRVAEALERLPLSARALEQGKLSWCAVRELTRVATAETEPAWLERAHGKTTRELEQLVAGKRPGDLPPRPGEAPPPRPHVLRFEVSPETFAIFKQATESLRRAAGGGLDDDALLLMMARQVLGTPTDIGRSSYRISYELCPACRHGGQVVGGELIAVSPEVLDMAACDGEHVGLHPARPANENHSLARANDTEAPGLAQNAIDVGRALADDAASAGAAGRLERSAVLEPATTQRPAAALCDPRARRPVPPVAEPASHAGHVGPMPHDDASSAPEVDTIESAAIGAGAVDEASERSPHSARVTHVGRVPLDRSRRITGRVASAPEARRARQAVPPAMRRAVLLRDRHRCQVPGCTHAQFVDVHHVRPRSEGGRNTLHNLITLCTAHHRAAHRGELIIDGSATGPRFRHADGSPYGQAVEAQPIDTHAKVFAALRHLGFREREVHAVLAELRADAGLRDAPANVLLREALRRIRPGK